MVQSAQHAAPAAPVFDRPPRVLIAAAPFYREIADHLIRGAEAALAGVGAEVERVETPGALELPIAIRLAADAGRFEGFVALGCVIRGETTHYETVCAESARGLMTLGVERGLAIGNGVLTVENEAQALARARPEEQDKGGGAALAALHLIALARRFGASRAPAFRPDDDHLLLA